MKMKLIRFWSGLAVAGLALLTGFATSQQVSAAAPAASDAVLRVGVSANMPPVIFKEGGEYKGMEADLARALGTSLKRKVEFVQTDWEDLIPALMAGKIDIIMSGMTITPERQVRVAFSSPYLRSGQVVLTRTEKAADVQVSLFWGKMKVGFQKGTTGEHFAQLNLNKAEKTKYSKPADGARALVKKKIDVFIHDAPVNWWLASENEASGLIVLNTLLTEEYIAWGVRKDDTALLDAANQFIQDGKKSGDLKATVLKWTGRMGVVPQ